MQRRILEMIWQQAVQPMTAPESARLKPLLDALLPMPVVALKTGVGDARVLVLPDETELMPALPLGDVIAEEMALDVPYGALVVTCDAEAVSLPLDYAALSFDLGNALGQTLLCVLRRGVFPLEHENEALYTMACAYDRMAQSAAMQALGLIGWEFSRGLALALGGYWSGSQPRPGLFLGAGCLANPELRHYLTLLDAGFTAPHYSRIPADMLVFQHRSASFSEWLDLVRGAVSRVLKPRNTRLIQS